MLTLFLLALALVGLHFLRWHLRKSRRERFIREALLAEMSRRRQAAEEAARRHRVHNVMDSILKDQERKQTDPDLAVLGLTTPPQTLGELRSARRKVMMKGHVDRGGSHRVAVSINNAFERVVLRYNLGS